MEIIKIFSNNHKSLTTKSYIARRVTFCKSVEPQSLTNTNIKRLVSSVTSDEIKDFVRRVSAANLESLHEPKLHQHNRLSSNDEKIWDAAYLEEYLGLHEETQTWQYISEEDYQRLRPVIGHALPSMAISKIKFDQDGHPARPKYRIVLLGNLESTHWDNNACFAPVLSPLELRLLTSIATQMKCMMKTGDVSQAFCQSILPADEKYVIRPPSQCPITPDNTYLLLKKTLYGLRRSPHHWYETCKTALKEIGLEPLPNAPCIFTGVLVEDEPPLYLGLFVDDFCYWSQSDEVEKKFETDFGSKFKIDFQKEITHFLGIKFQCNKDSSGHVTVFMSQETDILDLIHSTKLEDSNSVRTPYRSGYPIDSVAHRAKPLDEQHKVNRTLQKPVGSLNWITNQTRPDLATVTHLFSQYNHNCSPGHLDSAKYDIKYLKGTADRGIMFSSKHNTAIESYVKYSNR